PPGFDALAALPELLGSTAHDGHSTRLRALLRPKPSLRGPFDALVAAIGIKSPTRRVMSLVASLVRSHWICAAAGLAIGLLPLLYRGGSTLPWIVLPWIAGFALVLAVGAAIARAVTVLLRDLPANRYGFCSGMPAEDDRAPHEALTIWLADYIDTLS